MAGNTDGPIEMPTQASPLDISCCRIAAHMTSKSQPLVEFSGSTTTVPLKRAGSEGARTTMRVVYGASGVLTSTPAACPDHSYTLARPLTRYSCSAYPCCSSCTGSTSRPGVLNGCEVRVVRSRRIEGSRATCTRPGLELACAWAGAPWP